MIHKNQQDNWIVIKYQGRLRPISSTDRKFLIRRLHSTPGILWPNKNLWTDLIRLYEDCMNFLHYLLSIFVEFDENCLKKSWNMKRTGRGRKVGRRGFKIFVRNLEHTKNLEPSRKISAKTLNKRFKFQCFQLRFESNEIFNFIFPKQLKFYSVFHFKKVWMDIK